MHDPERPYYLYGTEVSVNEDKEHRGPKGSLDKPRAISGQAQGQGPIERFIFESAKSPSPAGSRSNLGLTTYVTLTPSLPR